MDADQQLIQGIIEQYGAAFTMVENIIHNCDEDLWQDYKRETIISQVVYHTLFFIDFYLAKDIVEREAFKGKIGDDLMGERNDGMEWNKIFTKEELLTYMKDLRAKADKRFRNLTLTELNNESVFEWHGSSIMSSLLYSLRHIMLHVGALHVRLNAVGKEPLKWVSKAPVI